MFGVSDELKLGDNMRGYLMVAALSELSAIVKGLGAEAQTPYSYAGLGDLLSTATSENSHHHELGRKLASGSFLISRVKVFIPSRWLKISAV